MSVTIARADRKKFLTAMKAARSTTAPEKAVEHAVAALTEIWFAAANPDRVVSTSFPKNTDGEVRISAQAGLFDEGSSVLIETKKGKEFSKNSRDVVDVLCQVCTYLRRYYDEGDAPPQSVIIADEDEIFALPTTILKPHFTNNDHDWSVAPSAAHLKNLSLLEALLDDKNIRPYIHAVNSSFLINDFYRSVADMMEGNEITKIPVTTENLKKLFYSFSFDVLGGAGSSITNQKQIKLFIRSLKGDDDLYLHPKKKNTLVDSDEEYTVSARHYEAFWNAFDSNSYSLKELKSITEIADTLIEDVDRRFSGDFWTPQIWVDRAHQMIEKALGEDWRNEYVVWDPAAGAKNLTRDYKFTELYSSTLHSEELEISEWYNKDNTAFQYDFLNDDMELHELTREQIAEDPSRFKMPEELVQALLDKKPVVFFANPPYGQATSGQGRDHKTGAAGTSIGGMMDGMGHARMELYTQFIYRTQLLAKLFEYESTDDFHFFFFNKGFLTSPNFSKFTNQLISEFTFKEGFMLNAGEFAGTSSAWGIIFSHWKLGGNPKQKQFVFDVLESDKELEIKKIGKWAGKTVKANHSISYWFRMIDIGKGILDEFPVSKNGFDIPDQLNTRCFQVENNMGYLSQDSSNIQGSDKYTSIYSMGMKRGNGRSITSSNFARAAVTFSIRRSVQEVIAKQKLLWVRDKDIFTRPSDALLSDEFIADCVVYSLFDRKSNQTSLRDYKYNGNTYRVVNEFFPFSKDFIESLAIKHNNLDIQTDLDGDHERFVYQWLEDNEEHLSSEAQAVLDEAKSLIEASFEMRARYKKLFSDRENRYQTNTWDTGWVQLNRLMFGNDRLDDSMVDRREAWQKKVRALGDKIAKKAMKDGVI